MNLSGLFKRQPKIEGAIGYFGLADWWLSTFSECERERIESLYRPMGHSSPRPLTQGQIILTSQRPAQLLWALAGWLQKPPDRLLARRVLAEALELAEAEGDVLDQHFTYQAMIDTFYRDRDTDAEALETAITACESQIALAPKAALAFRGEYSDSPLPAHRGFQQLAIIREKQRNYAEAIRVCRRALEQGWAGDWERRIGRCEKRADSRSRKRKPSRSAGQQGRS